MMSVRAAPAKQRKPKVIVRAALMDLFRNNVGVEYGVTDLAAKYGATPTGITGAINAMRTAGWRFDNPRRGVYVCRVVGPSALPPSSVVMSKRELDARDAAARPAVPAPANTHNGTFGHHLVVGDYIEVTYVSRNGIIHAEDSQGHHLIIDARVVD